MNFGQLWDQLVDCICRPPRDRYTLDDLIGGERFRFKIGSCQGIREDLELVNASGQTLQCSHYKPAHLKDQVVPCIVYCHCNSGSRRDAEEAIVLLIPQGISVFCMDFSGSGLSDGEWVTLGAREVDDLEAVVNHLRRNDRVSTIGLWGRSMGAVTALMYCRRDPSVAGVVLDSPFCCLQDLMLELVQEQQIPIPKPFVKVALAAMRRSVRKRAGFDIYRVAPLETVDEAFVPVLFGHANGDTFVKKQHSEKLHEKYAGDKNIITFEGDHNSRRPQFFYNSALIFFHNVLQVDTIQPVVAPTRTELPEDIFGSESDVQLNSTSSDSHVPGQTNVPWNPTWAGERPTSADFDEMLWAASSNPRRDGGAGTEQSASLTESDSAEFAHLTIQDENDWYEILPRSMMAEESMLQAALAASLEQVQLTQAAASGEQPRLRDEVRNSETMPLRPTEAENIANQVDLLHRELGPGLSAELPPQGPQQPDATGRGLLP